MGKKSKTKDKDKNKEEDEYIEEQTCNICFETILFGYKKKDFQPDNATACGNAFCMECIKKIIKPEDYACNEDTNPNCCGFFYTCPICRMDACVNRHNIFAILKGSHRESRKAFIKSNLASRQDVSPDEIDAIADQIFEALELN